MLFTWTSFYQRIQMQFIACNIRFEAILCLAHLHWLKQRIPCWVRGGCLFFVFSHIFTSFIVSAVYVLNIYSILITEICFGKARGWCCFFFFFIFLFSLVSFYYYSPLEQYPNIGALCRRLSASQLTAIYFLAFADFSRWMFLTIRYTQHIPKNTHI